jgi:hypothetical protein
MPIIPTTQEAEMTGRQGDLGLKPAQAKTHLNQKNLGVMMCTCHPSYMGSINRKIVIQARLRHKHKTLFKK